MIDAERVDFIGVPVRDLARADEFYGKTLGVCHLAFFTDPDGNGLVLHRRYSPYADGTQP